ncbi:hypothetical protein [Crocosphaera watsonii]|uniref:Cold-active alkaline serine protease n=3 Tax=Crocosphaera watsonii TaxID=263511 RepID=T2JUU1_CROWT|nr:hypothetical protein [Crocosphaera watsonii]EHJ12351.1 hypothetical protein CWATWH0003_2939 [Crocosphaera watsonii WH 0003]CCQ58355.1 hypothetical protein CWATWH0005_4196 [Crocosphaera watsonii WH 0005]CCQ68975.1 Cold-active alkaline serine protease [Crocosphaera watsonii WH 0402]
MSNSNKQRYVIEGLALGNDANNKIADVIASRSAAMLEQNLQENFETILEAKMSMAVQETLNLHTQKTQVMAKKFLNSSKNQLAQNMVDTQQNHQLNSLSSNLSLEGLEDFETDLLPEVSHLADESGAITVETNAESVIGF